MAEMEQKHQYSSETTKVDDEKESLATRSLQYLYQGFVARVRCVLVLKNGKRGKSMPPVEEPLLLEPAPSIAEKIRAKQVILIKTCLFSPCRIAEWIHR